MNIVIGLSDVLKRWKVDNEELHCRIHYSLMYRAKFFRSTCPQRLAISYWVMQQVVSSVHSALIVLVPNLFSSYNDLFVALILC